jgi:hypothetical protein
MAFPPPDEPVVLIHKDGAQQGPFSRRVLAQRVERGDFAMDDHFWYAGWSGWTPLRDHPGLLEGLSAPVAPPANESEDDRNDRLFGELVQASWDWHDDHGFASHVDEVFLGAVIASTLDNGYSLIDLTSDGSNHYLRFEDLSDKSRLIFRLTHLTASHTVAKIIGHKASVVVGYGERVSNITKVMSAVQAEYKSGFIQNAEPGTITVDGDLAAGYVYVQIDLTWTIDHYVDRNYKIDYPKLSSHIRASTHALRKYLRGRFN